MFIWFGVKLWLSENGFRLEFWIVNIFVLLIFRQSQPLLSEPVLQTIWTKIKLLLREQSDQGAHSF